jgi:hypothetical protein
MFFLIAAGLWSFLNYQSLCGQEPPPPPPFGHVPNPNLRFYPPPSKTSKEFIGHRFVEEKGQGWGWVKRPRDPWERARWVTLKENPLGAMAPGRARFPKSTDDHNTRYRLWGYFWDRKVYDPKRDELLEVFVIEGWELIGLDSPPNLYPGPSQRKVKKREPSTKLRIQRYRAND